MGGEHRFKGERSGACPTYFRIGTQRIKSRNLEFHNQGYDDPAWHLSIHLLEEFEQEGIELKELEALVEKKDDDGIIEWFRYYLPRAMKFIPTRKHGSFLSGFWRAVEDERVF
jgi:hypothetical protein